MQYHIYREIDRQVDAIVQCVYKVKVVAMAMREPRSRQYRKRGCNGSRGTTEATGRSQAQKSRVTTACEPCQIHNTHIGQLN